ncbi:MAG: ferritin-like domain-containing protein [Halobacteriales archaeon]|nr:ferritin-like domain-containing protein [Halobacteriales archaeon]
MTALDSRVAVPSEDDLARLLQIGVVIEEYAEEKSARLLSDAVDDGSVREMLGESLEESDEHRRRILKVVRRMGADIDEEHVESLVRDAVEANIDTPRNSDEALRQQLDSELLAYSYYDSLIEACLASENIDDETLAEVVETLEEIREDELEDAEKIENVLNENGTETRK